MQRRHLLGLLRQQMRPQHLGEEVVVAVPAAPVVQRHDEHVAPFQRLQLCAASPLPGDGVAQRATQPLEDGGMQQEVAHRCGLMPEDLRDQIVQHETVVPGERPDEPANIRAPAHRERRQLETGDPPLGALFQRGDLLRREVEAHRSVEERGRFGGR